jgi:hypothetical protein
MDLAREMENSKECGNNVQDNLASVTDTTFDQRYAPADIRVDGTSPLLDWSYATDFVGNITSISDLLNSANNRTYGYQDIHYFLTQGNGPWGPRSWTYDKIGNRLTETRGAITDTYTYLANATGGRNPKLQSVAPPTGESRKYGYDAAGNNTFLYDRGAVVEHTISSGEGTQHDGHPLPSIRMRESKKLIVVLSITAFAMIAIIYTLRFLRIDDCLDDGGRWNYEQDVCEAPDGWSLLQIEYNRQGILRSSP